MSAGIDARREVLDRLRLISESGRTPEQRQACFVQPARVAAALELHREGAVRCWTETWRTGGEVLVCELAVRPPGPRPGGGDAA